MPRGFGVTDAAGIRGFFWVCINQNALSFPTPPHQASTKQAGVVAILPLPFSKPLFWLSSVNPKHPNQDLAIAVELVISFSPGQIFGAEGALDRYRLNLDNQLALGFQGKQ